MADYDADKNPAISGLIVSFVGFIIFLMSFIIPEIFNIPMNKPFLWEINCLDLFLVGLFLLGIGTLIIGVTNKRPSGF